MSFTNVCFESWEEHPPHFDPDKCQYLIYQLEKCPTTGRLHWQSYAEFKRDHRLGTVQKSLRIGLTHVEPRREDQHYAIEYCKKAATRMQPHVEFGVKKPGDEIKKNKTDQRRILADAYAKAHTIDDYDEAMLHLRTTIPIDYHRSFHGISGALAYKRKFKQTIDDCEYGWDLPRQITDWLKNEFTKKKRARCLILIGKTKLGKTSWARSLGPHVFWNGMTAMSLWDNKAKYIVYDDVQWKYIPNKKQLLTQMGDTIVTDKYMHKVPIHNNKPAIVCLNLKHFEEQYPVDEPEYWDENATIVYLDKPLFDKTQRNIKHKPEIVSEVVHVEID